MTKLENYIHRYAFGDNLYLPFYVIGWLIYQGRRYLLPIALIIGLLFGLSGCAISDKFGERVAAGSSKYTYSRTLNDGSKCQVEILSARDVIGGELHVNPDCSIDSKAEQTKGTEAAMQAVNTALELAKSVAAAAK